MKATGIVRRIDDLGRVVIPKEIRRTLRIREGDPLEIFTDKDGEIVLKKYSPIGELSIFAQEYVDATAQILGCPVCVTDRDQIIAVSGGCKYLLGKSVSKEFEKKMENRENFIAARAEKNYVAVSEEMIKDEIAQMVVSPIICEGDIIGAVLLLTGDERIRMGDVEQKLVQTAAGFLGRQMEQ